MTYFFPINQKESNTHNLLTGISDHNAIFFSRKIKRSDQPYHHNKNKSANMIIPNNQHENVDKALKDMDWSDFMACNDVNVGSDLLLSKLNEVMLPYSKRGRPGRRNTNTLPWLNPDCFKLIKKRDQLLKKSIKSGLNIDRLNFTRARNKVTAELRKAKADFFIQIIDNAKGDGRKIWQNINKLTGKYPK